MEWGTFITVVITIYLAWYGFNFLFDLFLTGKPKVETESAVHYQVSDLMAEEEEPRQVLKKDFEEKPVRKAEPAPEPAPAESTGQSIGTPAPQPAPQPSAPQPEADDWASVIDQEEEKEIDLPVQGQPISVSAFIQSLKDEAKLETSSIAF